MFKFFITFFQMPWFPVYTRSGQVSASIELLSSDIVLSEQQLEALTQFHHFVFADVLHLVKDPMEYQPDQADFGCLVVPLNGRRSLKLICGIYTDIDNLYILNNEN